MFTPRGRVFKMSKKAHSSNFMLIVPVWATYLSEPGRSYLVLAENSIVNWLWT